MKNYEVIFADLDGTLINTISGETFPKGIWDMKINFEVFKSSTEVKAKNFVAEIEKLLTAQKEK